MSKNKQFLSDFITEIKPDLSQQSIKQYTTVLCQFIPEHIKTDKDLKKYLNLKTITKIVDDIKEMDKNDNTKRNYVGSLLVVIKEFYGDTSKEYKKLFDSMNTYYNEYLENNKKPTSDKDHERMVTSEEYKDMIDESKTIVDEIMDKPKPSPQQIFEVVKFSIVYIYYFFGGRNDLHNMRFLVNKPVPKDKHNYIQITTEKDKNIVKLIFREYKTSKTYGENVINLNDDIEDNEDMEELIDYIVDYHDFITKYTKDNIAFPGKSMLKPISSTYVVRMYTETFQKKLNKAFTLTLNRKRIVSEDPDIVEYKKLTEKVTQKAKELAHSVSTQQNIYLKTDYNEKTEKQQKPEKEEKIEKKKK